MNETLTLVTAPTVDPVTVAEAKTHLHVEHTWQDDLITSCISAATQWAELFTSRAFVRQVWEMTFDGFPDEIRIPRAPLISIDSIYYVDSDGMTTLLPSSEYQASLRGFPSRIVPAYGGSWPATRTQPEAVIVQFTAGYPPGGSPEDLRENIPESIKSAIKLVTADLFQNRDGAVVGSPWFENPTVIRLLGPHRYRCNW